MDELLDLVDENDIVIATMWRAEVYAKKLSNFRAINAFLKNSKGEVWIPLRVTTKRVFPLHLDMSVGGHVSSGETYDQAFVREVQEEINLDVTKLSYKKIGLFVPHKHGVSAFQTVYEIDYEQDPDFNKNDFIKGQWMLPQDALQLILSGQKAKGDLPKLLHLVYGV
ncbi:MAG: NUDIX hydrolase [candidate division TM6 bacterium GW2011_GWF2_28_16]|nr:MAG: NUDIX hydrolase [candidate division TM6 bacterium GW2011_GWF2_28_16]